MTSPVGYAAWVLWAYFKIFSASFWMSFRLWDLDGQGCRRESIETQRRGLPQKQLRP